MTVNEPQSNVVAQTAKDRLIKLDQVLDEYEVRQGLPQFEEINSDKQEEIAQYLAMGRNELEALAPEDCGNIHFVLTGLAFSLRRSINREVARVNWAIETIKKIVCSQTNDYRGAFDMQFSQAVRGDEAASKLLEIQIYAAQRRDRLKELSFDLQKLAESIKNIQFLKQSKAKGSY